MNSRTVKRATAIVLILLAALGGASVAEHIPLTKSLTIADRRCLAEILRTGHWRIMPEYHRDMMAAAVVARAGLKGNGQNQYIFVLTDFGSCGTAGCSILIGETDKDSRCHEIYDDAGSEVSITVLPQRDHGYRRLLTPCEVRFDGREYRKIHDECPNANVWR